MPKGFRTSAILNFPIEPVERLSELQSELGPGSCADNGTTWQASLKMSIVGLRFTNCAKFDHVGSYRALF